MSYRFFRLDLTTTLLRGLEDFRLEYQYTTPPIAATPKSKNNALVSCSGFTVVICLFNFLLSMPQS
jgi:hypothetical protein